MRTSAAEVSIHAVSPESIFAASSAHATEPSASTAANASDARTHHHLTPKDRCLLSISPPRELEETVEQWWCHDPRRGVNRKAADRGSAPAQFAGAAYFLCSARRGSVPAR